MSRIPRVLALLLGLSATLPLLAPAQAAEGPGQGRRQGGQRRGMMMARPGGGDDMQWLLRSEQVQKELELVADQKAKLKTIAEETRTQMHELYSGIRNLKPEERRKKMAEARKQAPQLQEEAVQQALGVLTTEQRESFEKMKGEKFELDRSKLFGPKKAGRGPGGRPSRQAPPKK